MIEVFWGHLLFLLQGMLLGMTLMWILSFISHSPMLLTRRRESLLRKEIVVLLACIFLWCLIETLGWSGWRERWPLLDRIRIYSNLLIAPLAVLLLTHLTHRRRMTWRLVAWHIVPTLCAIVVGVLHYTVQVGVTIGILTVIYLAVEGYGCHVAGRKFMVFLENEYTEMPVRGQQWLTRCFICGFTVLACWAVYFIVDILWVECLFYLAAIIAGWICCRDLRDIVILREQAFRAEPEMEVSQLEPVDSQPIVPTAAADEMRAQRDADYQQRLADFRQQLEVLVEGKHLYRDENLTRAALCKIMAINHTYFSQMLSEATGMTFYEYINNLRLDEAEVMLCQTNDTLDIIAAVCGFGHKSTFHRAFRERHGCSPTEFRKACHRG